MVPAVDHALECSADLNGNKVAGWMAESYSRYLPYTWLIMTTETVCPDRNSPQ